MKQEDGSNDQTGSESNPCPICLGPMAEESYLDTCLHKFCYNCIVSWDKALYEKRSNSDSSLSESTSCPLCRKESFSVITGTYRTYFQRRHRFTFSTYAYRLRCYNREPGILNDIIDVVRFWESGEYLKSNSRWLDCWLKRELLTLMYMNSVGISLSGKLVDHFVRYIHFVIYSFFRWKIIFGPKKLSAHEAIQVQQEFKIAVSDAAKRYLGERTDRFVDELELFLASGFDIEAYDQVYMQRLGLGGASDGSTRPIRFL
ncbi:Zinc finger, RING-type [Corchorus olitorius]|uniref:Zinc finger, RING-type n=1 Tax=Corchorus olitorius TaxID=93759 RepID=A0A1R3K6G3_9ROSI|nr:Zinc finger, RING-type [Corchorus olitorius]